MLARQKEKGRPKPPPSRITKIASPLLAVLTKKQTAPEMIRRPNEKPGQKVTEAEGNQRP